MATSAQELTATRMAVASAKMREFRRQCWRLAWLVRSSVLDRVEAADCLYEIAVGHALIRAHGDDRIQAILAEAFAAADFNPLHSGDAAA